MAKPEPLPRVVEEPKAKHEKPQLTAPGAFAPRRTADGAVQPVGHKKTSQAVAQGSDSNPMLLVTTEELIQEPSLLEVLGDELRIKYRLPEDDPTFALIKVFSECECRELKRQQAFEHFAHEMLREAKWVLDSSAELSASIRIVFERLNALDISMSEVQECVERFEEFAGSVEKENTMRLKAMAGMQNKLETLVCAGLEKNFLSKMLNHLMLALAVLAGVVMGGGGVVVLLRLAR
jgi:hypothetical protein